MKNLNILIDLLSYEGLTTNNPADAIRMKGKIEETTISGLIRYQIQVADLTVDQVVTLPDASSEYLVMFIDRECSIKLNNSLDSIVLKPRAVGIKTPVFFYKGTVTSLKVSNSSGDISNLDILIANK